MIARGEKKVNKNKHVEINQHTSYKKILELKVTHKINKYRSKLLWESKNENKAYWNLWDTVKSQKKKGFKLY